MKLVFVCSPYRGDVEYNTSRAQGYCRYASREGVIPFAPHLHNPQFLDDNIPEERQTGMQLGLHVLKRCEELWCFGNKLTEGMEAEIRAALQWKIPIKYFDDKCEEIMTNESMA